MGFFEKLKSGLNKTKDSFDEKINNVFKNFRTVDEDFLEELEEILIMSDIGLDTSVKIINSLRDRMKKEKIKEIEFVYPGQYDYDWYDYKLMVYEFLDIVGNGFNSYPVELTMPNKIKFFFYEGNVEGTVKVRNNEVLYIDLENGQRVVPETKDVPDSFIKKNFECYMDEHITDVETWLDKSAEDLEAGFFINTKEVFGKDYTYRFLRILSDVLVERCGFRSATIENNGIVVRC